MFIIKELYDVDGGFGDAVGTSRIIGVVETEEQAKEYCEKYSNPHTYAKPYAELECGELTYTEVKVITLNDEPSEFDYYYGVEKSVLREQWGEDYDKPYDETEDETEN